MKIVKQKYEILTRKPHDELKHIEKIGRVCYKSEDRISEDDGSAKKFVTMLVDHKHLAMIEHATLAFKLSLPTYDRLLDVIHDFKLLTGQHCQLRTSSVFGRFIVSGNLRVWKEVFDNAADLGLFELPSGMLGVFNTLPEVYNGEEYERLKGNGERVSLITEDEVNHPSLK